MRSLPNTKVIVATKSINTFFLEFYCVSNDVKTILAFIFKT
jgi:hypothetical protein